MPTSSPIIPVYIISHAVWMYIHGNRGWFLSISEDPEDTDDHLSPRDAGFTTENGGMQDLFDLCQTILDAPYEGDEVYTASLPKVTH